MSTTIEWTEADILRFRSYLRTVNGCLLWQGSVTPNGYGKFWLNNRNIGAHRFAFIVANQAMPQGVVRHACDQRLCCNPEHLISGSQLENVLDARERGRTSRTMAIHPPRLAMKAVDGERNGRAKLSRSQVDDIRAAYAGDPRTSLGLIAKRYKVSKSLVQRIIQRKVWTT